MPTMRTPLISLGSSRSGTPEAVGTQRLVTMIASYFSGFGQLVDRFADVFEQLAGHQGLGVERHIADRAPRAIEVRGEGEAVDTAGRARQHGCRAPHAQPTRKRAECRAHGLRLVVRAGGIVLGELLQHLGLARLLGSSAHGVLAGMAPIAAAARYRRGSGAGAEQPMPPSAAIMSASAPAAASS
jgi:hypothetical protein